MDATDDPRVRLAAERTLLAWIRTGVAVMALGFVLNRHGGDDAVLAGLGIGLIASGAGALGLSARQYHRFYRDLGPATPLRRDLAAWSVWFAVVMALIGAALGATLLAHAPPPGASPPAILPKPAPTR